MKSKQATFEKEYASKLWSDDTERNQEGIYYKKSRLQKDSGFYLKMILVSLTSMVVLLLFLLLY